MLKLENEFVSVTVKAHGAELCSLFDKKQQLELLWQAGPEWPKHAPVLFPIVGQLFDYLCYYEGKACNMNRHGFARELDFAMEEHGPHRLAFSLHQNETTLKQFPYHFKFEVIYLLRDKQLHVQYRVINTGDRTLPFSVGAHPAFNVPLTSGERYSDYRLVFDAPVTAERWPLQNGLIGEKPVAYLNAADSLALSHELFSDDAIVFKKFPAKNISLVNKAGDLRFRFHLNDAPYLGIWAAKHADFVCIEPWHGIADSIHSTQEINEKEGIIKLLAGEVFSYKYSIELP